MVNISEEQLAIYLTYEFTVHFNPNAVRGLAAGREVKVWACKDTGLPIFTFGRYHGPSTENGLPLIGEKTIHLRISKADAADLSVSQAAVAQNSEILMANFMKKIYLQIRAQVADMKGAFNSNEIAEMMRAKQSYLKKIELMVGQMQEKSHVH